MVYEYYGTGIQINMAFVNSVREEASVVTPEEVSTYGKKIHHQTDHRRASYEYMWITITIRHGMEI